MPFGISLKSFFGSPRVASGGNPTGRRRGARQLQASRTNSATSTARSLLGQAAEIRPGLSRKGKVKKEEPSSERSKASPVKVATYNFFSAAALNYFAPGYVAAAPMLAEGARYAVDEVGDVAVTYGRWAINYVRGQLQGTGDTIGKVSSIIKDIGVEALPLSSAVFFSPSLISVGAVGFTAAYKLYQKGTNENFNKMIDSVTGFFSGGDQPGAKPARAAAAAQPARRQSSVQGLQHQNQRLQARLRELERFLPLQPAQGAPGAYPDLGRAPSDNQ